MKINKKLAVASLLPASVAGLAVYAGTAQATQQPAHHATARVSASPSAATPAAHPAHHRAAHRPRWVTVRRGDTLSSIAAAHHMTWQAIYATPPNPQHLGNPAALRVGLRLRIPDNPRHEAVVFKAKYAAKLRREYGALQPATSAPAQAASTAPATSGQSITAGMSAFEACVAWHESGDNPTASSAGLFGILPSTWASLGYSGTAGEASVTLQKQAFDRLYAQYGTSPWAPYDGC
jgi:hypothetical protein